MKKIMKNMLLLAAVLLLCLSQGILAKAAQKLPASGTDGGCKWEIDKKGNLNIEVNGDYKGKQAKDGDIDFGIVPAWFDYRELVKSVKVVQGEEKLTTAKNLFLGLSNADNIDLRMLDTSEVTDMNGMFRGCGAVKLLDLSQLDTAKVKDMQLMFCRCETVEKLDLSSFDTKNVTNLSQMFNECNELKKLDVSNFDTSKVTDMSAMFRGCQSLDSLKGIENFDTKNVTDMGYMFYFTAAYGTKLKKLDLSHFDTSKVTRMDGMLYTYGYWGNNLDLRSFDLSKVKTMEGFFPYALKKIQINPKKWSNLKYLKAAVEKNYDGELCYSRSSKAAKKLEKYLQAWVSYNKGKTKTKPVLKKYYKA